MFEEWGGVEWVLLVINSIALYIAADFWFENSRRNSKKSRSVKPFTDA